MKVKTFSVNGIQFGCTKHKAICMEPICMDIETSNNHAEDAKDLITWITSIQVYFNGKYYLFRNPYDLTRFYNDLEREFHLIGGKYPRTIVTYIHNASYDLSYLIPYFKEELSYPETAGGILKGPNKFLSYTQGGFEFRCSYLLSGMSLDRWSKEMNTEHKKKMGLYDYDKIIYPDDNLTDEEAEYDKMDVIALKECLDAQMSYYDDDMTTIPLTATGYMRREMRRHSEMDETYRARFFIRNRLSADMYDNCVKSFAGGMTHNNRFYKDITIESGKSYRYLDNEVYVPAIGHRDFKSHYPSQLTCREYPLGAFFESYNEKMPWDMTIDKILECSPEFSTMSVIRFYEAEIRDPRISMPFMQYSKCNESHFDYKIVDNGRIIKASGSWIMSLDNLTLDILNKQYKLTYEVLRVYEARNERLPQCLIDTIDKFFKGKSDKKNTVKELLNKYGKLDERTVNAEFELTQDKKQLNAGYGCAATNPLRIEYALDDNMGFHITQLYNTLDDMAIGLDSFYDKMNNFLPYQVGVWCTAWARHELFEYIETIGYENVLYVDTDSAFYIKTDEVEKRIESLNAEKQKTAHYVTLENGQREYYDSFCKEPDCIAFRGLHSKCYGIVTDKGLELTIAGVPARTLIGYDGENPVYLTREAEMTGTNDPKILKYLDMDTVKILKRRYKAQNSPVQALGRLEDGFTFTVNAGTCAVYVGALGNGTDHKPSIIEIDGHVVFTAGGCVIKKLKEKIVHDCEYDLNYEYGMFTDC